MGEDARRKSDGAQVKIGTNEDMYYLRFDQRHLVEKDENSLDVNRADVVSELRFRFPFPDEDRTLPGDFRGAYREVGVYGVEVPEGVEHHRVQFKDTYGRGWLAMVECPLSDVGKLIGAVPEAGGEPIVKFMNNGYSGAVRIVAQRIWDGSLVTVCQCGGCGSMYRLPTWEDAEPLVVRLRSIADGELRAYPHPDESRAKYWNTIADRIAAGYAMDLSNL